MAHVCSTAAFGTYGMTSNAPTSAGPGRGRGEGTAEFSWDMALLEELENGSLGTTVTSELKIPDPIISFKNEPPLLIRPSLLPSMAADDQERAKACWDVLQSIGEPPGGLTPVQVRPSCSPTERHFKFCIQHTFPARSFAIPATSSVLKICHTQSSVIAGFAV